MKKLNESILTNLQESSKPVLKKKLEEEYNYNWRDDIDDMTEVQDEYADEIFYAVGEKMSQEDPETYPDPWDAVSDIIGLWKIEKRSRLYDYLIKWYGSEDEMLKHVRDVYETDDAIYFVTGCGYSIWSADLFGGTADGEAERQFTKFVENGGQRPELTESLEGNQEFWDMNLAQGVKFDTDVGEAEILNFNKPANYILVKLPTDEWVAAWNPEISDGKLVWGQGHYFDSEIEAKEYLKGLNESAKPKRKLTEAPEDEVEEEEFDVVEDEGAEVPEDDNSTEMSADEVEDEAEEDEQDTIEDDIEQPFYATTEEFDELRDVLVDLGYRLLLINDNMVVIGRLNGADVEILTSNNPEDTEVEVSEENKSAEEVEEKAEEDGEKSYEYLWIKAPDTLDKLIDQCNVIYLSPDMSEEDKEQYAGKEASHESLMNYLMNELPEEVKDEKEEEEEEIPEEIPEELPKEEDEDVEE